jgi:hypothetical protein
MYSTLVCSQGLTNHKFRVFENAKEKSLPKNASLQVIVDQDTIKATRKGKIFKLPPVESDYKMILQVGDDILKSPKFEALKLKNNAEIWVIILTDLSNLKINKRGQYEVLENLYLTIENIVSVERYLVVLYQQKDGPVRNGKFTRNTFGFSEVVYKK